MNMLSQFTREEGSSKKCLSDLGSFPSDAYPVGRRDGDSEGLLSITNDKSLTDKLLNPKLKHERTYLVQVEGVVSNKAINKLCSGVEIRIRKSTIITAPAKAKLIDPPEWLPERHPPVRYRATIPTSWIELTISEGKNRQVRRMTAAVGFPTLRLVRTSIGAFSIKNVLPDQIKEISGKELMEKLF